MVDCTFEILSNSNIHGSNSHPKRVSDVLMIVARIESNSFWIPVGCCFASFCRRAPVYPRQQAPDPSFLYSFTISRIANSTPRLSLLRPPPLQSGLEQMSDGFSGPRTACLEHIDPSVLPCPLERTYAASPDRAASFPSVWLMRKVFLWIIQISANRNPRVVPDRRNPSAADQVAAKACLAVYRPVRYRSRPAL